MGEPKATIVTACRDGFDYLRETIPTVLNQDCPDWEWIIVDDGSVKPLADVFPQLRSDPRVRIHRTPESWGQTWGLNFGIREARTNWIVRMDGDDLCSADRLRLTLGAVAEPGSVPRRLVFSDYEVIGERGETISTVRYRDPLPESFFKYWRERNNPICHPTVAFYKFSSKGSLYQYREDLRNAQDYALWKEILQDYGREAIRAIPKSLLKYRVVRTSLSGAGARQQRAELTAIQKGQVAAAEATHAWTLGNRQQAGMQAYRIMFYRFVGDRPAVWTRDDVSLLLESLGFRSNFLKALVLLVLRPMKLILKKFAFGGGYR
jgi:hypothetical protein